MKITTAKQAIEYFEGIGCVVQIVKQPRKVLAEGSAGEYSVSRRSLTRRHIATFKSAARLVAAAEKSRRGTELTSADSDD